MGSKATCGGEERITAEAPPPLCLSGRLLARPAFIARILRTLAGFFLKNFIISLLLHRRKTCSRLGVFIMATDVRFRAFIDAPASFTQVLRGTELLVYVDNKFTSRPL